ncbi:hypothetical protein D3C86_1865070 [compost metagenome]
MATSPVPPCPLWQQETIATSIGCMPIFLPTKKPVATSADTVLTITTRFWKVKALTSSCHGVIATPTANRIG